MSYAAVLLPADSRSTEWQYSGMGISFDRDARVAGYRVSTFRDALRSYLSTHNPGNLVDVQSIFKHRRDGAIIYEELLDRGLIDRVSGKVTEAGKVLLRSRVVARTPLKKAEAVLEAFLDRVDALNADLEAISRVDEIWLFGSMLRKEAAVGDIDLAVVRSRSPRFSNLDAEIEQGKALLTNIPDAPSRWRWEWDRTEWLYQRAVFGKRRHALLAGAKEGVEDLKAVATPCRLIYDRVRGGQVTDAILSRHPLSEGRADTVDPLPVLPDLAPAPLQPMDARWVTDFDRRGLVWPYSIFRGWTEDCRRLFPEHPENLRVATTGDDLGQFPWVPTTLKRPGLDGRAAVAIVSATKVRGACVTLRRSIQEEESGTLLIGSLGDLLMHRSKRIDLSTISEIVAVTSLILAVDAERALRRVAERGGASTVTVRIQADNMMEEMRSKLRDGIMDTLARRIVAIEPAGYGLSVAVEVGSTYPLNYAVLRIVHEYTEKRILW